MTDVKISALPAATDIDGTELVPIVQGGVTKRVAVSALGVPLSGATNIAVVETLPENPDPNTLYITTT